MPNIFSKLPPRIHDHLVCWWHVCRIAYLRFSLSAASLMAAAIAFFAVICVGPLGLLAAAVLQYIMGSEADSLAWIEESLEVAGPDMAARVIPMVELVFSGPVASSTSVISVMALAWAGLRLFEIMERSLTEIWPGKMLRGFIMRKVVAMNSMIAAFLLLGLMMTTKTLLAGVHGWLERSPEVDIEVLEPFLPRFLLIYQFVMAFFAFTLIYRFMPVQRVPLRVCLAWATIATLLWLVASQLFAFMMGRSQEYGVLYGGLAGTVVFAMWAFIGAQTLLFGGHFAVAYEHIFLHKNDPSEDEYLSGNR